MQIILKTKRNLMALFGILILLATACGRPAIEPNFSNDVGSSMENSDLESTAPITNVNDMVVDEGRSAKVSLQMKGLVEKIQDNELQINGQTISIDSETSMEGTISTGDRVEVKFSETSNGALMALRIELINSTGNDDSIDDSAVDDDNDDNDDDSAADNDDDSADDYDDDSADDNDDDSADDYDDDSADDYDDDSADDSNDDSADDSNDDSADDSNDDDNDSDDDDNDSDDDDDDSSDDDDDSSDDDDSHDDDKHDD